MFAPILLLALSPVSATPPAAVQTPPERRERPQAPYSLAPVSGTDRAGQAPFRLVPAGAPAAAPVPVVHPDDGVPLPEQAVYRATPQGDVLERPASGDPFFLGFAAGPHHPDAAERVAPELYDAARALGADGRPRPETYAFVMFSKRMTPARLAALEAAGCRLLGFHPHYTQKVALSEAAIDRVEALDFVRWVGTPRPWQKVHPRLATAAAAAQPGQTLDVWINVHDSDATPTSRGVQLDGNVTVDEQGNPVQGPPLTLEGARITDGWQTRALEAVGIEVLGFAERLNAFRARAPSAGLDAASALDFVQFIELDLLSEGHHDESMPLVNMDDVRNFYDGSVNQVAISGIVDSGVEIDHADLNFFGIGTDMSGAAGDAFDDNDGHGTHVAGTILGEGVVEAGHTGAAPGLGFDLAHAFHVVRLWDTGTFSVDYGALTSWETSVHTPATGIPHVFNNSWGSTNTGGYLGTEVGARSFDDTAYTFGQLNVFSSGNAGPNPDTLTVQGSAKNVLTVGNVYDRTSGSALPTTIASDSSRGPTGDGRWKPSVVAPGSRITSASNTNNNGYSNKSGTSMAAPHVTGLVSALIDRHGSTFAYLPERIMAHLMATAVRKDAEVYTTPGEADLDVYGAGRIDGTSALWSGGSGTWTTWAFSLSSSASTSGDFTVPSNATRLVAVMNYVEPSASSGASQALINDFDLWLDRPPLSSGNNSGEYSAQQSSLDNTEIRVVDNPISGTWRWKMYPDSATSTVFAGISIYVETTDTSPDIAPVLTASQVYAQPDEAITFDYDLDTSGGTISGVYLDAVPTGSANFEAARTFLKDGIVTDLSSNWQGGDDLLLGNIHPWFSRQAQWEVSWPGTNQGNHFFCVQSYGDNASNDPDLICVSVTIDGVAPGTPQVTSGEYFENIWTTTTAGNIWWSTVPDTYSGVDGYSWSLTSSAQNPPQSINLPGTPIVQGISTPVSGTYFFNLAAVDKAGNWGGTESYGPILVDLTIPTAITGFASLNHNAGEETCEATLSLSWDPASDAHSGLAGYGIVVDQWPTTTPPTTVTTTATSYTEELSDGTWYAHLITIDNVGNTSQPLHFGPIVVDTTPVSTYCTSKVNSQGCLPAIGWVGSAPSASAGSGFDVIATNTLDNKNGLFFYGYAPKASQFQGGWLCVQAPIKRTGVQSSGGTSPCGGQFTYDFNAHIASGIDPNLMAGTTVYGQYWSRDPQSSFNTNRTDAIQMTICP